MKQAVSIRLLMPILFGVLSVVAARAQEGEAVNLREVLELGGVGPTRLKALPDREAFTDDDWQVLIQVVTRLEQFRDVQSSPRLSTQPPMWSDGDEEVVGAVFEIEGHVTAVEEVALDEELARITGKNVIYVCSFAFADATARATSVVEVLSSHIPRAWKNRRQFDESVTAHCVLVRQPDTENSRPATVVTSHLAWYPTDGVPTGQALLARHGMDVALLDEVVHRQPFVKPEVSREGEAFYAGLKALLAMDLRELTSEAQENVAPVAEAWRKRQPELAAKHRRLTAEYEQAGEPSERERLALEVRRAKTWRDLATTIARQAENGQSSVATMFLQPEQEVGELFFFEGTARRAVWIAVEDDADLAGYYEVEVYPIEARLLDNRPVVCCVHALPEGFLVGDLIREPVQIAGVFFKSWRYRSRNLVQQDGETETPRQLYTPVLLAKTPTWLSKTVPRDSRASLWAGIAFLVALATVWASMTWLAKRDRRERAALRPRESIDIDGIETT